MSIGLCHYSEMFAKNHVKLNRKSNKRQVDLLKCIQCKRRCKAPFFWKRQRIHTLTAGPLSEVCPHLVRSVADRGGILSRDEMHYWNHHIKKGEITRNDCGNHHKHTWKKTTKKTCHSSHHSSGSHRKFTRQPPRTKRHHLVAFSSHGLPFLAPQKLSVLTRRLRLVQICFEKITQNFLHSPSSFKLHWVAQHISTH